MISTLLMLVLINASRLQFNEQPLQVYSQLEQRAELRAKYIYNSKQWSHLGWKESFIGLDCSYIGENLAREYTNTEILHKAFLKSPSHAANILKARYNVIGIGTYEDITVELFCDKNK